MHVQIYVWTRALSKHWESTEDEFSTMWTLFNSAVSVHGCAVFSELNGVGPPGVASDAYASKQYCGTGLLNFS